MKDLIITDRAQADIKNAFHWYFDIRPDLGEDLLGKINDLFQVIRERPTMWPPYEDIYRHCIMPRFPYSIVYADLPDKIKIVALAHHSMDRLYWEI